MVSSVVDTLFIWKTSKPLTESAGAHPDAALRWDPGVATPGPKDCRHACDATMQHERPWNATLVSIGTLKWQTWFTLSQFTIHVASLWKPDCAAKVQYAILTRARLEKSHVTVRRLGVEKSAMMWHCSLQNKNSTYWLYMLALQMMWSMYHEDSSSWLSSSSSSSPPSIPKYLECI